MENWTNVPPDQAPAVLKRIRELRARLATVKREDFATEREWRAMRAAVALDVMGVLEQGPPRR